MKTVNKILLLIFATQIFQLLKLNKMAETNAQRFRAILDKIDESTNKVATEVSSVGERVKSLQEKIKNAGLDQAQEEAFLSELEGIPEKLNKAAESLQPIGKEEEVVEPSSSAKPSNIVPPPATGETKVTGSSNPPENQIPTESLGRQDSEDQSVI